MRTRQQGAGLLIPVVLVVTVAAFAVVVAASQSGTDIQGSDANADGQQALFVAETGVERALKRFATGTACGGALTQTITDLSTIGLGTTAYRINIGAGLTTDFAGAALPATQCRVPVSGTVLATNVSRTIHAIVDRNLLEGPDNPTFNNPLTAGAPSGWTLNPATSFANTGGPDGTAPNCSRSVWHVKRQNANVASRAQINVPVNFTYTGGTVTAITFHWRAIDRTGGGCAGGAASGPAWGGGCPGAAGETQSCFRFTGTSTSTATFQTNATVGVAVACPDVAGPSIFAPCSSNYQIPVGGFAYPLKQVLNMTMAGAGTRTATNFFIHIRLQQAGRREIFIDHIEATNNTAVGAAHVRVWRDCSTALCP
jgi:hypothetical protein